MSFHLLCTAQEYGLGPVSKLVAIATELGLSEVRLSFIGQGATVRHAAASNVAFDQVLDIASVGLPDLTGFDGVLSVMEDRLVAWAYAHRLPVFHVDSLSWNWRWTASDCERVLGGVRELDRRPDAVMRWFDDESFLARRFAAYVMANMNFVQEWPQRGHPLPVIEEVPVRRLGAIVGRPPDCAGSRQAGRILVSLSGMGRSSGHESQRASYAKLLRPWLEDLIEAGDRVTIAVPTGMPASAAAALGSVGDVRSLTQSEMLEEISFSSMVLAPPGLTTMLECAMLGTPLILLPEQHPGHIYNARQITALGDAFMGGLLTRVEEERFRAAFREDVPGAAAALLRDEHAAAREMVAIALSDAVAVCRTDRRLGPVQRELVRKAIGGFEGAATCAALLLRELRERR